MARTETRAIGTVGAVIGAGVGLLALAGALLFLGRQAFGARGKTDAELCEELLPSPRPLGLALVEGAHLPSGERFLRLAPSSEADAGVPDEVVLLCPPSAAAAARLFRGDGMQGMAAAGAIERWQDDPKQTLHAEVERGELGWGPYTVPFVRERAFLASGAWRDAQRLDLSTRERPLLLIVLWPEGVPAVEEPLKTLLGGVTLPEERVAR